MIKQLWPHIGKVVFKQAVEQAGPQLDAVCKQVRQDVPYAVHRAPCSCHSAVGSV